MKAKNSGEGGWGLGLLLVFFFDEETHDEDPKYIDKKRRFSSSSSLSPFKSTTNTINTNLLISRAQSTISICALIFFFTLLLFTLCTFEPTSSISPSYTPPPPHSKIELGFPRRWLPEKKNYINPLKVYNKKSSSFSSSAASNSVALQGMGTLFRRGTKAMNDLHVAHLTEDTTDDELRLFLRSLHRSALMAKSDVVFIFPSPPSAVSPNFSTVIREENESFLKLVHHYRNKNDSSVKTVNGFDLTQFLKSEKKQGPETLWGRRIPSNYSNSEGGEGGDDDGNGESMNELNYGSVLGFEAAELDPEDSLSGFLDHHPPPIRLRRWACYPMLLGRVRRNFKHVVLVDVKNAVVLGDPLVHVRNGDAESIYLWKNSEKTQSHKSKESKSVSADAIMGGMRGVRRLSNAMLNEIVKASTHHHKSNGKNSVSESVILSQLVQNESLLKSLEVLVTINESPIPDTSSLLSSSSSSSRNNSSSSNHSSLLVVVINRGGSSNPSSNLDLKFLLWKEICSSTLHSSLVYRDC